MNSTTSSMISRCAAGLAMATFAFGAAASSSSGLASAEARFKQERQACLSGQSHQDRETCLKEARNALAEARKGHATAGPEEWRQNALARCDRVPEAERKACQKLALGEGKQSGSVEGGGVIKEITTVTVGPPVVLVPVQEGAKR